MSNSVFKKTTLALLCVGVIVVLVFVKPQNGYFNSVGSLIQSKLDSGQTTGSQHSLDLKKLRPNFHQGR